MLVAIETMKIIVLLLATCLSLAASTPEPAPEVCCQELRSGDSEPVGNLGGRRLLQLVNASLVDQNGLLQFKRSVADPNGTLSSWDTTLNGNHCAWIGVTCSNTTIRRVVYLTLIGNRTI